MIISKFHFFKVEGKFPLRHPMKLYKSLFRITPKTLKAINIDLPGAKPLFMIHFKIPVPTKHQGIIASKFICIDNRTPSYGFYRHLQNRFYRDILNHLYLHLPVAFQYPKNRHFMEGSSAASTLPSPSKIGFIQVHLLTQKLSDIGAGAYHRVSNYIHGLKSRGVVYLELLGDLIRRNLQSKELYQPKPLFIRDIKSINPSPRKIMKRITTSFTSIAFLSNSIYFIASTFGAKNMAIFPAEFFKKQPSFIFCFCNKFKGFYLHWHHYTINNLVPKLL